MVMDTNKELGEIAGTFISFQPSDTDMGSKEAKTVSIMGKFFAKVDAEI